MPLPEEVLAGSLLNPPSVPPGEGDRPRHPAWRRSKPRKRKRSRAADFTRGPMPYTFIISKFNINICISGIQRS
jgi:hypothetical protein